MKLITFSLWGDDPKYLTGAIKNVELAKTIYPDWICRIYVGQSVPRPVLAELRQHDNVQVYQKPDWGNWEGMYWRFEPASEPDVDVMISRDTDSRLNYREKAAVDEWLASDADFHIMRDHPWHKYPILGGMWGAKKGAISDIKDMIDSFSTSDKYGTDYEFFAQCIIPTLREEQVMIHDEFFARNPFPAERKGLEFVGEVFNENEENVPEHTRALEQALEKKVFIHHHLGLGDHIDCNGMIRRFLKSNQFKKAYVFTKKKYFDLIDYMYRDNENIELIEVSNDKEHQDVNQYAIENDVKVLRIGHENYPWGKEKDLGKGCAEIFYDQIKMPYSVRFDDFYYERDEEQEIRLLKKLNPQNKPYVFVHDDSSRGYEISDEKILEFCEEKDICIIRNDMTENLFYYGRLLENAKQIHCMESCFRSLAETLDIKGELYFHNFRSGASGYLGNSTRKKWKEVVR